STPRLSPSPIAPRRSSTAAATSAPCTLSLHDALPICLAAVYETFLSVLQVHNFAAVPAGNNMIKIIPTVEARQVAGNDLPRSLRSEEHTSELQSREKLVCRLLLEKKNATTRDADTDAP